MKVNGRMTSHKWNGKSNSCSKPPTRCVFPYFHIFSYDFPQRFPTISHWNPGDELEDLVERRMSMGSNGSTSMIQNMTWGCPAEGVAVNWAARTAIFGAVMVRIMVMMMMMVVVVIIILITIIPIIIVIISVNRIVHIILLMRMIIIMIMRRRRLILII